MRMFKAIALLLFICFAGSLSHAASIDVRIEGAKISIHASQAPLNRILDAVTRKTGIAFKTSARLNHPVSMDVEAIPVEEGLHRLLDRCNYAVFYEPREDGRNISEIWVFGTKSTPTESSDAAFLKEAPDSPADSFPPRDEHMKRFERDWFRKQIRNKDILQEQISGVPESVPDQAAAPPGLVPVSEETDSGNTPPSKEGLRITAVSQNSLFEKVGINKGDFIEDVNGYQISTESEFVEALDTDLLLIRIGRLDDSGHMDPLYIELQ